jgi:imidazolonepropionase-like amidohydrolase
MDDEQIGKENRQKISTFALRKRNRDRIYPPTTSMRNAFVAFLASLCILCGLGSPASAQSSFPAQGLHSHAPSLHVFTHCNIVRAPGDVVMDGTLVIRDGNVENVGKNISVPQGAAVHDLHGFWIFPGFVDAWSSFGLERPKRESDAPGAAPQYVTKEKGPWNWNEAVNPEFVAAEHIVVDKRATADLRALGFSILHVVPNDGIFRGTSALLNLGDDAIHTELLQAEVGTCLSWDKGATNQSYPSSLMGTIALIRQTLLDAAWYAQVANARRDRVGLPVTETNLSLEAINRQLQAGLPIFFDCGDWLGMLRAQKIASEFGIRLIFKTDGGGYQRLDALKAIGRPVIVPLNFPDAYDIKDPAEAREVPLRRLWHWESAPTNPAQLDKAGIQFALTLSDLKKPADFWPMLQKAIRHGLSAKSALAALTTTPASILGLDRRLGTLDPGKMANFFIADEDIFAREKVAVYESWIAGRRYAIQDIPEWDPRGQYQVKAGSESLRLLISGKYTLPKVNLIQGTDTIDGTIKIEGRNVSLILPTQKGKPFPQYRLYGIATGAQMSGEGVALTGARLTWAADLVGQVTEKQDTSGMLRPVSLADQPAVRFPCSPFGHAKLPEQKVWLLKGATVWTNTAQGKLENAEVLIADGKVQAVGKGLMVPPDATVVDATGMHITPGIIDEHSHIAISGDVNEGSHANTAEVRIGDVIDCENVNIYRQLAGGVTTAQLLHGSANPIGGQSAIIKLRWGAQPEDMKFAAAPGFIKFALGENVKQSNWGDPFQTRYPQTRMGVEQFIQDAFSAAIDYRKQNEALQNGLPGRLPQRRNLQLETLLEIMDGKRFITCHSYVQSEIVMLMRLAESMGFKINTFTHVLEGYKIADKLLAHGANASTFSDWWAYKYEVIDAIPHNAGIMTQVGVNVCINSDDTEMGRRLNQEAGKSVKYAGMSEEDALKMVTLNPAKALHIDQYVGSIAQGKDADIVLWSDHPLSIYAVVQKTFIDGRLYFDRENDRAMQLQVTAERQRLVQKMMDSPDKDKKKFDGKNGPQIHHCESYGHE